MACSCCSRLDPLGVLCTQSSGCHTAPEWPLTNLSSLSSLYISHASVSVLTLARQWIRRPWSLAALKAGTSIDISIAMIAITTSSSISVKAFFPIGFFPFPAKAPKDSDDRKPDITISNALLFGSKICCPFSKMHEAVFCSVNFALFPLFGKLLYYNRSDMRIRKPPFLKQNSAYHYCPVIS